MSKLVDLEVIKWERGTPIKRSLPFIDNKRARLVHRVRSMFMHKLGDARPHYAVKTICNASFAAGLDMLVLTEHASTEDKPFCRACAMRMAEKSLPLPDVALGYMEIKEEEK